jgi:hypothetical protein
VKLHPEHQHELMTAEPKTFTPANGAWGRQGATIVKLKSVTEDVIKDALHKAWQNMVPKPKKEA